MKVLKILVIRLHAAGDTALSFPACISFKKNYPDAEIDLLTLKNYSTLADAFNIFNNIYFPEGNFDYKHTSYRGYSGKLSRYKSIFKISAVLRRMKYDKIIDLQNNRYSRLVRKITGVKDFSEFDNYAPKPHSIRVLETFDRAGFKEVLNLCKPQLSFDTLHKGETILKKNGWDGIRKIILINPAGLYETRRWGDENYFALAQKLIDEGFIILLAGTNDIKEKANEYSRRFNKNLINLVGKTSLYEITGVISCISGAVSDDSGLFHITWALGKPGILLLGATRSDWTCQPGNHTLCFNSSDLECGNCMKPDCKYGDIRCLNRFTPEFVLEKLLSLL
ncbi:MAG: glycosyltransferase family 9 protein [Ignavibacteria bacterium]|nr:glycosyltransferase family 9 protein [Ignavibacteria bacterium]